MRNICDESHQKTHRHTPHLGQKEKHEYKSREYVVFKFIFSSSSSFGITLAARENLALRE